MRTTIKRKARARGIPVPPATVRVAVYTRKSVTEGLDQEFNTLDAQREAVEAYVRSQRANGWQVLPERYDDGGFTGANTDRPAFQRLLRDVHEGKVDVIAVYRLDRLSRSLLDLTALMEVLDRATVGFVSVTEHFDTSTPAGRMVLNLLATFAQYERESIAQRTRDKMLASRQRGLWTGGRPVLGYDVVDKRLVINPDEAEQVRTIFQLYLELGSLLATADELRHRGWTTKSWTNKKGKQVGGGSFNKGSLHSLLTNPLYVGKVRAGDDLHDGAHDAIVDEKTWKAVAAQLRGNGSGRGPMRSARSNKHSALLKGIVRCACGAGMTFTYTKRSGRSYGYYVCVKHQKEGATACPGSRIAVGELDAFVIDQVRTIGRDPELLDAALRADRADREERKPELVAEVRRHQVERARLQRERQRLLDAVAEGGAAAPILSTRLVEIDQELAVASEREQVARGELLSLDGDVANRDELRADLENLEPIWDELFPAERSRLLSLLLKEVVFHGQDGEAEVVFREDGPRAIRDGGVR